MSSTWVGRPLDARACAGPSGRRCRRRRRRPCSPSAAIAAARLTVTEDLPTPPLPEATAYTRVSEPGWANGISRSAWPPRSAVAQRRALLVAHHVERRPRRAVTPATAADGGGDVAGDRLRIGQPATVSSTRHRDARRPRRSRRDSTMPSSVIGRRISGSLTVASAARTASSRQRHATMVRAPAWPRHAASRSLRARSAAAVAGSLPRSRRRRRSLQLLEQVAQLGADEVAGGDLAERHAQRGDLAGRGTRCRRWSRSSRLRSCSSCTRSRSACRFCASRISGAAYDACSDSIRVRKMNGYGSNCSAVGRQDVPARSRRRRTTVMQTRNRPVPMKRAIRSESRPKRLGVVRSGGQPAARRRAAGRGAAAAAARLTRHRARSRAVGAVAGASASSSLARASRRAAGGRARRRRSPRRAGGRRRRRPARRPGCTSRGSG